MSRYDQFMQAKQVLRAHPGYSDAQVAEQIGTSERDTPAMRTIAEARRDLAAGDSSTPDLRKA